jgi:drug/metabolite transporter (DMT)-like permease
MSGATLSPKQLQMLFVLTLVWGINWPVMKFAVGVYNPLSFRLLSMLGGVLSLALVACFTKQSLAIPRAVWGKVFVLALPNMVAWHVFCILAVKELSSGRAAMLGYTMPVWAVLWGLLFGQRLQWRAWLGIALAFCATLLLLSGELSGFAGRPLGAALMLIAAASWGFGTVLIRLWPVGVSTLALTHAMLWITVIVMSILTFVLEKELAYWPTQWVQWWPIAYNAIGVFAFCHLAWFSLASSLPPVASGLSVMLIPVVGLFSGMLWLQEAPHWQDYAALVLIMLSMSSVLLKKS